MVGNGKALVTDGPDTLESVVRAASPPLTKVYHPELGLALIEPEDSDTNDLG
ncbi:hypothetical protein [Streptomyces sediminimaris]|uniref:hypothetical protein n=1 Tax=Streptomyces sediminimaris TaxID=3383721 RepID=UPI00399C2A79